MKDEVLRFLRGNPAIFYCRICISKLIGITHHLDAFFTGWRIASIGPSEVTKYVRQRQEAGATNAVRLLLTAAYFVLLAAILIAVAEAVLAALGLDELRQLGRGALHLGPDLGPEAPDLPLGARAEALVGDMQDRLVVGGEDDIALVVTA